MNILILTGGTLCASAPSLVKEFRPDYVLAADAGLEHAKALGLTPNGLLGDFDSASSALVEEYAGIPKLTFPAEKDYTDTELALLKAIDLAGPKGKILLLGALGTRMDHTLANIFLLKKTADVKISCMIADDHNRIRLFKGPVTTTLTRREGMLISLLPVFGDAKGVTLSGFYYPLHDQTVQSGWSLGVSNYITEEKGQITLKEGYLLVIEAKD